MFFFVGTERGQFANGSNCSSYRCVHTSAHCVVVCKQKSYFEELSYSCLIFFFFFFFHFLDVASSKFAINSGFNLVKDVYT